MSVQHWSCLLFCVAVVLIAGLRRFGDARRSKRAAALNQSCQTCDHAWGYPGHLNIAPTRDPDDGGIIVCRVQGCDCFHAWFWRGKSQQYGPDAPEVAALRQRFQSMSLEEVAAHAQPFPDM